MQIIDIFGRDNCSFCDKAKRYCVDARLPHRYHDVRDATVRASLMGVLQVPPKSVPVIMVGRVEIAGGFDGLVRAHASGALQQIMAGE